MGGRTPPSKDSKQKKEKESAVVTGAGGKGMLDNRLKSLFAIGRRKANKAASDPIPLLSPIANSVISRCSRVLLLSTEKLLQCFETELPDHATQSSVYARHLVEYCAHKALHVLTKRPDYLTDKDFRCLTFDMMLALEASGAGSESSPKETASFNHLDIEDENGASLFYTDSTCMAVQVDDKKSVGPEAFARIAPLCPAIADSITVHNLFDALTSSLGGRLPFLIYDKYLKSLNKVIKIAKSTVGSPLVSTLQLTVGEIILDVDGAMPTQPVLQRIGMSSWPGRLTLTNYALYFESAGVGSYNKPVSYDLATDFKQLIKRELTGPLGARLFDKALLYKSTSLTEPIYFEFPEIKGHSRRDYWLAMIREVLHVHKFIRNFNLKEIQQEEALSKAIFGIFRYRAVKKAFHIAPSHFKSILAFNLAEKLTGGDKILEALHIHLELLHIGPCSHDVVETSSDKKSQACISPVSLYALTRMGFLLAKNDNIGEEPEFLVGDVCIGLVSSIEMAVKEALCHSERVEAARATVDQVKLEGIDTNLAVMQELLFPVLKLGKWLSFLVDWEEPLISTAFLILILYASYRGWVRYIFPSIFLTPAVLMLWHKYRTRRKPLEAFKVTPPPSKNPVEQLLMLQEAISQLETHVKSANIILLKLRALLFAEIPQVTDKTAFILIAIAAFLALLSSEHLLTLVVLEALTREMPLRKMSSDKLERRLRDWWNRVPAAPVELIRPEENKKRKGMITLSTSTKSFFSLSSHLY